MSTFFKTKLLFLNQDPLPLDLECPESHNSYFCWNKLMYT